MAEENDTDTSDKTEEASAHKLEEARKKGNVVRTPELPQTLSLIGACLVVVLYGPGACLNLARGLQAYLADAGGVVANLESGHGVDVARRLILSVTPVIITILGGSMTLGVFGNLLQTGFLFLPDKLAPDMSRLSLAEGFKRLFGIDALANFAKTLIKLIVVSVISWFVLVPHIGELTTLTQMAPAFMLGFALKIIITLAGAVCAFLFVGAGLDYLWQRFRFMQRMRMSKQELKDEYRQTEGDPHVKARQRQIRMERSRKRMMANVRKAKVVITNPTHYAVALAYESEAHDAPLCVAKGADTLALKIREEAARHNIPIVEDPPLARALYATVEVDQMIDPEHYRAVSKVLSFILLRKRSPLH